MTSNDIILRLLSENFTLKDQLKDSRTATDYWREKAEDGLKVDKYYSPEEAAHAMATAAKTVISHES